MSFQVPPAAAPPGSAAIVYADLPNRIIAFVIDIVVLAISAGYFIYTWTSMRATFGMKALGMQIGNEGDGATLTMNQAARRWIAFGGWVAAGLAVSGRRIAAAG